MKNARELKEYFENFFNKKVKELYDAQEDDEHDEESARVEATYYFLNDSLDYEAIAGMYVGYSKGLSVIQALNDWNDEVMIPPSDRDLAVAKILELAIKEMVTDKIIENPDEMIDIVCEDYKNNASDLCSLNFNFDVKMTKADIITSYALVQELINEDEVCRIINKVKQDELIPDDTEYQEIYEGNCMIFLENFADKHPEFIRISEGERNDFIF